MNKIYSNAGYIVSIPIFLAALGGCALTTEKIDIEYAGQSSVQQIPGASKRSVGVQVIDLRADKSKVGSKKNGYGMEMAPITASEDVAVTVCKAIEREVRARGFQVAEPALIQVAVDVTRFDNDHKPVFFRW